MPLWILVILVVGGIGGITLALHLLGLSRVAPLTEGTVRTAWQRHYPDDPIIDVLLARNGRAAAIQTHQGRALLWQLGADTVARYLGAHSLHKSPKGLTLRFSDYTAPRVRLVLEANEQAKWQEWLVNP